MSAVTARSASSMHWDKLLLWRRPSQVGTYVEGMYALSHTSLAGPESRRVASLHAALSSDEPTRAPTSSFLHRSFETGKPPSPSLRDRGRCGRRSDKEIQNHSPSTCRPHGLSKCREDRSRSATCMSTYSTCDQKPQAA
jgi:hypothetical protein